MRIFALVFLLVACAKAPSPQTAAVGSTAPSAAASLAQTESLSAAEAIRAAGTASLGAPGSFPAATALRCWRREEHREAVRQACLLAWSAAGAESPELTAILRASLGSETRIPALAATRRQGFAQVLSEAELLNLLSALKNEAPWIRAHAVLVWLAANKPANAIEADRIYTAIHLPESDGSPATFASRLALSSGLGLAKEAGWLRHDYCVAGATGPAITRCLRVLSALADPKFGDNPSFVRPNLPPRSDPGTIFFQRSFPSRAHDFDNLR